MRMAHGFDPAATYQVSTWRGIEYGGRKFRDGEVVTAEKIPPQTLYTFYRFRMVAPVQPSTHATTTKSPSAPGTQATAATGAGRNRITVEPQPRQEAGVTATRPPLDRKWLATASTDELRRECEVRGRDTHGDKNQLRARLLALVG